jgi:alanyl-tRNA synthetase
MQEQKNRAKANWKGSGDKTVTGDFKILLEKFGENSFDYSNTSSEVKVLAILDDNFKFVEKTAKSGWVFLEKTVFYAESGGQIGDIGKLGDAKILDTKKFLGLNLSQFEGELEVGKTYLATVSENRIEIQKHHSATHILHKVLQDILGQSVKQAGSLVEANRLRFDFTYSKAIPNQTLKEIEERVNRIILKAIPQITEILPIDEAKQKGAMALFGEKYGEKVRVVSFGDFSIELCGGTHVKNTNEIGQFIILKESGVSAGVRRIEAIVGKSAIKYFNKLRDEVNESLVLLKSQNLTTGIEKLKKEIVKLKNEIKVLEQANKQEFQIQKIGEINYIIDEVKTGNIKNLIDELKNKHQKIAVMLFQKNGNKVLIASGVKNLNIHAGNWIKKVAPILGGGGGGRPDFAQAGGKDSSKIAEAKKVALDFLTNS